MEDKELQQLFEAKRTVEANRRRQAALEAMIAAHGSEGSKRRLWPVWAGAAAAGVALLLLSLPAMYNDGVDPVEVAQVQPIEVFEKPETIIVQEPPTKPTRSSKPIKSIYPIKEEPAMEPVAEETTIVAIEPVIIDPANEESDVEKPAPEEAITAPRVHRRTSTLLACTEGCTITTVPYQSQSSSTDIQQLLADALGSKNNGPLTLKTFELQ